MRYIATTFLPSLTSRCYGAHSVQYAEELYGDELEKMRKETPKDDAKDEGGDGEGAEAEQDVKPEPEFDIEAEIAAEVKGLRKPTSEPLFTNVKVDVQCGESTSSGSGNFLYSRSSLSQRPTTTLVPWKLSNLQPRSPQQCRLVPSTDNSPVQSSSSKLATQSTPSPSSTTSAAISPRAPASPEHALQNVSHP
jgi:hypothetical protein